MKRIKKCLTAAVAAALTLALTAPALAYVDVAESAWYYDEVQTVTELGLMTGGSAGAFRPGANVTRATVLTVLWRMEGSPEGGANPFPDVPEKHWAYAASLWAREVGIVAGYANGNLGPDDAVTREQMAAFLYQYALLRGTDIAQGVVDLYPDAGDISPWALTAMKHVLGAGLMVGVNATLAPRGLATRAELASTLVRLTTPVKG